MLFTLQAGVGEEVGWRGFAQQRLQRRWGLVPAALVVGATWALWHVPLFLIPDSMQWQLREISGWLPAIGGYSAYLLLSAVFFALLMNQAGSPVMPMLLHGSLNATAWLVSLNEVHEYGMRPVLILTGLMGVVVLGWLSGPRSWRKRPAT